MQVGIDISIFKLIIQYALAAVVALGNLVDVITGYWQHQFLFFLFFFFKKQGQHQFQYEIRV